MALETVEDVLKKYPVRDKLLRLGQYTAIFCNGLFLSEPRNDWFSMIKRYLLNDKGQETGALAVSKSFSSARLVFRLLNTPGSLSRVKKTYERCTLERAWEWNDCQVKMHCIDI